MWNRYVDNMLFFSNLNKNLLKLNNVSISPYLGERPDPEQTFKLTSLQNFSSYQPSLCLPLVLNHGVQHRQSDTVLMETPQDTIVSLISFFLPNSCKFITKACMSYFKSLTFLWTHVNKSVAHFKLALFNSTLVQNTLQFRRPDLIIGSPVKL